MDSGFRRNDAVRQASPDVQDADEAEEAAGGVEIQLHLPGEAFLEELGGFVVDGAAGHVDRFQPVRRFGADGFEIAVADREIVAHRALEAGEAEADRLEPLARLVLHLDGEAVVLDSEQDAERTVEAFRLEEIGFEQVEDGDAALLLDLVGAADDGALVELDVDDLGLGHSASLAAFSTWRPHKRTPFFSSKPYRPKPAGPRMRAWPTTSFALPTRRRPRPLPFRTISRR